MKKVGILGGTFNPIHNGHIHLAQKALDAVDLDQILFIPSGISYMKNQNEILPPDTRMEMVQLAAMDNSHFSVSDIEIEKGGNSYSHETIRTLQEQQPQTEFFFLIGQNRFRTGDTAVIDSGTVDSGINQTSFEIFLNIFQTC